ncbi:hypothetical protein MTR67_036535 [Solanum verrucosum]|uniref:Uncharacterized protein n=1 Tax=Solanum verrucosum TaxID=315347 RepID=A0AAF0UBR3_SOLVR|nr:hypothetical protein MTR67_036535 [Solanum verrucosum]
MGMIGGNFNVCRFENERTNCTNRSIAMREFSDTIMDLQLIDLPLQEAKIRLWLKEGDRNTRYYQYIASSHERNNNIDKVRLDTGLTEDKAVIKEEILNFYQNLYTENEAWRPNASFDDVA